MDVSWRDWFPRRASEVLRSFLSNLGLSAEIIDELLSGVLRGIFLHFPGVQLRAMESGY